MRLPRLPLALHQSSSVVLKTTADIMGTMLASGTANSAPSERYSLSLPFVNPATFYANSSDFQTCTTRPRNIATRPPPSNEVVA